MSRGLSPMVSLSNEMSIIPIGVGVADVQSGSSAVLQCLAHGYPVPKINWYHNDKIIPSGNALKFILENNNSILRISTMSHKESGVYRCEAVNVYGKSRMETEVNVFGKNSFMISFFFSCYIMSSPR